MSKQPKPKVIKYCPRYKAGHRCKAEVGLACNDCGRGITDILQPKAKP